MKRCWTLRLCWWRNVHCHHTEMIDRTCVRSPLNMGRVTQKWGITVTFTFRGVRVWNACNCSSRHANKLCLEPNDKSPKCFICAASKYWTIMHLLDRYTYVQMWFLRCVLIIDFTRHPPKRSICAIFKTWKGINVMSALQRVPTRSTLRSSDTSSSTRSKQSYGRCFEGVRI